MLKDLLEEKDLLDYLDECINSSEYQEYTSINPRKNLKNIIFYVNKIVDRVHLKNQKKLDHEKRVSDIDARLEKELNELKLEKYMKKAKSSSEYLEYTEYGVSKKKIKCLTFYVDKIVETIQRNLDQQKKKRKINLQIKKSIETEYIDFVKQLKNYEEYIMDYDNKLDIENIIKIMQQKIKNKKGEYGRKKIIDKELAKLKIGLSECNKYYNKYVEDNYSLDKTIEEIKNIKED